MLTLAYPGIDPLAESRKALAWLDAHLTKRKTNSGMKQFLTSWMNRAQNDNRSRGNGNAKLITGTTTRPGEFEERLTL